MAPEITGDIDPVVPTEGNDVLTGTAEGETITRSAATTRSPGSAVPTPSKGDRAMTRSPEGWG
jgi:hypothetical protein